MEILELKYNDNIILFNKKTKEFIVSDIIVSDNAIKQMPVYPKNKWSFYNSYVVGVIKGDIKRLKNTSEENILNALKRRNII